MVNILIVHYNTPELTEACVKSINKHTPGCKIYIFDNSDKRPFTASFNNVEIIDNTKGLIIDFDRWLEQFPERFHPLCHGGHRNNWGSAKHCYTIQVASELLNVPFIHVDSDALVKKDITELYNEDCIWIGRIGRTRIRGKLIYPRVVPYIFFMNSPKLKELDIHYFNPNKILGLTPEGEMWDTGSSFFLEVLNQPGIVIDDKLYIEHFKSGSWFEIGGKRKPPVKQWLEENKELWK